jgi:D-sedoheptulose 7-phosphate isomerase
VSAPDAFLSAAFDEAARVQAALRAQSDVLEALAARIAGVLGGGGQAFFFGNGGSAADAQHWAAELSGRFYFDRPPLAAHALPANAAQVTAIGNDYGYDEVFARPLRGMARAGDLAVGISTSGTSANVLRALEAGRTLGTVNVGFCGADAAAMQSLCDVVVSIPSRDTARIQEGHALAAHLVLALVERRLFGSR